MRFLLAGLLLFGSAAFVFQGARADDEKDKKVEKKEVKLKGRITCGKCELMEDTSCATVIVVKDKNKKDITYYFDAKGHKANHAAICSDGKNGSVEGVISKQGKKNIITVKKVTFD
jgi:hypothetical protein